MLDSEPLLGEIPTADKQAAGWGGDSEGFLIKKA